MAERGGFEPPVHLLGRTHDFQSCPFGRSGISPKSAHCRAGRHFQAGREKWRREGDSNPRGSFWPPNRFRVDPVMTTSVSLRARLHDLLLRQSNTTMPLLRNSGTDICSTRFLDSRLRGNDRIDIYYCRRKKLTCDVNLFSRKNLLNISEHSSRNTPVVTETV